MNSQALRDATEAFAVPGEDSLIDLRLPTTGLSWVNGETLEQIRLRYPGAEVVGYNAWIAAKAERQHTPIQWAACPEERYHEMLNVLPPADWIRGGFLVGEPVDHDAGNGQPRYAGFRHRGTAFEESSRPMTQAEFRLAMAAEPMACTRCGQPTVYKSRICRHCQRPEERPSKASERGV